jgi:hypothetical protein
VLTAAWAWGLGAVVWAALTPAMTSALTSAAASERRP